MSPVSAERTKLLNGLLRFLLLHWKLYVLLYFLHCTDISLDFILKQPNAKSTQTNARLFFFNLPEATKLGTHLLPIKF